MISETVDGLVIESKGYCTYNNGDLLLSRYHIIIDFAFKEFMTLKVHVMIMFFSESIQLTIENI